MKKKNKIFSSLAVVLLSIIVPLFTVGVAKADRASDYCDETIPVTNSTAAGDNAACVQSARAAESACIAANGAGNSTSIQCIENYYDGVTGQSGGNSSPGERDIESVLGGDEDCSGDQLNSDNCAIVGYLVVAINILSAVAGMAIVFSIMFAGFQYMTARDNPGQIQQARTRIIWAISAMLIFIFSYAILNFLVPGGVI